MVASRRGTFCTSSSVVRTVTGRAVCQFPVVKLRLGGLTLTVVSSDVTVIITWAVGLEVSFTV